jgi:hypothetical protein
MTFTFDDEVIYAPQRPHVDGLAVDHGQASPPILPSLSRGGCNRHGSFFKTILCTEHM